MMNTPMKLIAATLSSLLLSACASTQIDFKHNMDSYIGLTTAQLDRQLGKAEQRYQQGSSTVLVYRPLSFDMPIPAHVQFITGRMRLEKVNQKVYANCVVHFSLQHDLVESWTAQGKECPKPMMQSTDKPVNQHASTS